MSDSKVDLAKASLVHPLQLTILSIRSDDRATSHFLAVVRYLLPYRAHSG